MLTFLVHVLLTAALLLIVAKFVSGVEVTGWGPAIVGALVLGIVNAVVRPVMVLLTLPFTVITFGLFLLVINALMLWLVAALVPGVKVKGFGPAFLGSLLLTALNLVIAFVSARHSAVLSDRRAPGLTLNVPDYRFIAGTSACQVPNKNPASSWQL